ncbi:hypothetical protein [Pontibacter arcticus]|uniref:Uncharacterized protein n=1 Tax=Pontibacter arcticus TaxID=2080288 RepID=A0A364RCL8_9BACT|nr:hypothetical protein [Pontibacter arcticus]RAU82100.1 hypothetical protein DP923_09815 [Pontibacter arcticus]
MTFQEIFINLITILVSLFIFYSLRSYWPKYFETKGANQATKEDIGEITEIVENIKSDLLQQNEFLKAQLSFYNQHKINLKNAEREAILDFNRKISAWLFSIVRFTFTTYKLDNYKDLNNVSIEFGKRQYECDLAEAHLELFIHDQEFLNTKMNLNVGILDLEGITDRALTEVYWVYSIFESENEFAKDSPDTQRQLKEKLLIDLDKLTNKHRKESLTQYKKVHKSMVDMRELINTRLKQLEEEEKTTANIV